MASNPTNPTAQELRILGRALRELRQQAGLTQKEMGARAGVRDTYISEVENGRRSVRWITVTRFLQILDVDLHQLVDTHYQAEQEVDKRAREAGH